MISQWLIEPSVNSVVNYVISCNEPPNNCWLTGVFYFPLNPKAFYFISFRNEKCVFPFAEKSVSNKRCFQMKIV